jgi:DHA1 family inner membrane transport protein
MEGAVYATAFFSHFASRIAAIVVPLWVVIFESSPFFIGVALGSFNFLPLLLSIPGGAVMDRLGARRLMMVFALTGAGASLLYPIFPWLFPLIVLQMFVGFSVSMTWIGSQTLLGEMMKGSPTHAGRLAVSSHVGAFVGPPVAGLAWDYLGPWGGFSALVLCLLGVFLTLYLFPIAACDQGKTEGVLRRSDFAPKLSDYRAALFLLAVPVIFLVVVASMLDTAGIGIRSSFYVIWLKDAGYSATSIGILLSSSNLLAALGTLCAGSLTRFFNAHWVLLVSVGGGIALISITPLLGSYTFLLAVALLMGAVRGLGHPLLLSMISAAAGRDAQGKAVGLRITANRLVGTLTPVVMGVISEALGLAASFYVIGGALVLVIAFLIVQTRRSPIVL